MRTPFHKGGALGDAGARSACRSTAMVLAECRSKPRIGDQICLIFLRLRGRTKEAGDEIGRCREARAIGETLSPGAARAKRPARKSQVKLPFTPDRRSGQGRRIVNGRLAAPRWARGELGTAYASVGAAGSRSGQHMIGAGSGLRPDRSTPNLPTPAFDATEARCSVPAD